MTSPVSKCGRLHVGPGATTGLLQNLISIGQIHGSTVAGLQIGTAATNQGNLRNNIWTIGSIQTFSGIGIQSYGSYNEYTVGSIDGTQGALATGISIASGAVRENFHYGSIGTATSAFISDAGTCSAWDGAEGTQIALPGSTSGCVKIVPAAAAGTWTDTVPTTAGTALQFRQTNGSGVESWASTRQSIVVSSGTGTQAQNTTAYTLVGTNGTETNVQALCPISGTFRNLYVLTSAPASGQTVTATWRVANTNTSLTCTITGTGTTCNDTSHTATCTAGQAYDLQTVTSATTGSITSIAAGVEFDNP